MSRHVDQVLTELLVLRAQGGQRDAVEMLARAWQQRLLRHAQRMTGRDDAGWDVLQEAWLGILRGLRSLEDPARFGPWAYRIVTHASAQWVRRQQRRRRNEAALADERPSGETAVDAQHTIDQRDEIRAALRQLPRDQRAILELRYVEDYGIDQIAEALAIAPGTVKSRLFHARAHLRAILERTRT